MNELTNKTPLRRSDLLYPELSYSIIGCVYDAYNELGPGHSEKTHQKALAIIFETKKISFKEQVYYSLKFKEKIIGRSFLDFLVDEKVIVELKKDERFSKIHIEQVLNYLKLSDLSLAILINFTKAGVVYKRIINVNNS